MAKTVKIRQQKNGHWKLSLHDGREQLGHETTIRGLEGNEFVPVTDEATALTCARKTAKLLWPSARVKVTR